MKCHEEQLGQEIIEDCASRGLDIVAFVNGIGTGGVITGVSKALKEAFQQGKIKYNPKIIAVQAQEPSSEHKIYGISDGKLFIKISSVDAIQKTKELMKKGYFVGISSGANILACERVLEMYPELQKENAVVVSLFCDSGNRYLSTLIEK